MEDKDFKAIAKALLQSATTDKAAVYNESSLDALVEMRKKDVATYMALRRHLKALDVGITSLEESMLKRAKMTGMTDSKPDHLEIAKEIITRIGAENIIGSQSHIWIWDGAGVWKALSERELRQKVQQAMHGAGMSVFRSSVEGVTDVLKSEVYGELHEWNKRKDFINVLNGTLAWDGMNWNLSPHKREDYFTSIIPHSFDQFAMCPRFERFLKEIFEGDVDAESKATALLEMIGYTLVNHADFERFVILVGNGANGKSVLLEVIKLLVGSDNVAAVQPSKLGSPFQRAYLHNKLANLVTEIPEGAELADAEVKAIVSGELTTVEQKYKDPFDCSPYATCWFGTNHLPHTRDFSDALFRRALVVPFNRTFKIGENADPNLKRILSSEMQGILNLALEAYGQVINRGGFTEPESCLAAKAEWRIEADQAAQYIADRCIADHEAALGSTELYQDYLRWADEMGIRQKLTQKGFVTRLKALGFILKPQANKRVILGIRWK